MVVEGDELERSETGVGPQERAAGEVEAGQAEGAGPGGRAGHMADPDAGAGHDRLMGREARDGSGRGQGVRPGFGTGGEVVRHQVDAATGPVGADDLASTTADSPPRPDQTCSSVATLPTVRSWSKLANVLPGPRRAAPPAPGAHQERDRHGRAGPPVRTHPQLPTPPARTPHRSSRPAATCRGTTGTVAVPAGVRSAEVRWHEAVGGNGRVPGLRPRGVRRWWWWLGRLGWLGRGVRQGRPRERSGRGDGGRRPERVPAGRRVGATHGRDPGPDLRGRGRGRGDARLHLRIRRQRPAGHDRLFELRVRRGGRGGSPAQAGHHRGHRRPTTASPASRA